MMPITPSGTRTREISRPFGRVQRAITWPTGSASAAISRKPRAIAATRSGVEPEPVEKGRIAALALRRLEILAVGLDDLLGLPSRSAPPSAPGASFFASVDASASSRAASRARRPI